MWVTVAGSSLDVTGSDATVEVDVRDMTRVLDNLVTNAVRHTAAGGRVGIGLVTDAEEVLVQVDDACGGIPPDVMDRIFEAGYRGTSARTPGSGAGAGLGLAIVRGLVEAHGGAVAVSNVGPGCRFEVRLPRARPGPG